MPNFGNFQSWVLLFLKATDFLDTHSTILQIIYGSITNRVGNQ